MICFLKGDYEEGMESLENLMKRVEEPEEYAHLLPRCSSKENAKKMVLEMIQRRDYFSNKPSFKKMKREFVCNLVEGEG